MEQLGDLLGALPALVPVAVVIAVTVAAIWVVQRLLFERVAALRQQHFSRQLVLAGIGAAGVVMAVIALPASEETRVELLRLLGLIVSAVIAFSSTTLVSKRWPARCCGRSAAFAPAISSASARTSGA